MNDLTSMKKALCFLLLAVLSVSVCGCNETPAESANPSPETAVSETSAQTSETETSAPVQDVSHEDAAAEYSRLFSDRDKSTEYGDISADIVLKNTSAQVDGDGVSVDGAKITITEEGIYHISGTLDDGQIIVNADKAKVQLILDHADITCKDSSPIYGVDSDKIFISLAEGSVNTLTDGTSYAASDEPDACIFSKDSLTINGTGILNINANFADGIHSKDDVVITGGTVNITSAGDGIKGKDYVAVCGGTMEITSGQDGIKSTRTDDASLGFIYIEGGDLRINAQNDGMQSETDLIIAGGNFDITSGGGSENATKVHTDTDFGGGRGFGGAGKGDMTRPGGFDRGEHMQPGDGDRDNMTPPDGFDGGEHMQPGDGDRDNMTPPDGFDGGARMQPGDADRDNMTPPDGFDGSEMTPPQTQDAPTAADQETSTESTKGLKGGTSVAISGGVIAVNAADDAIHSNGEIAISGGSLTLAAGDDGIHAASLVTIEGGTVEISESYEGIEAAVIQIRDGIIDLKASDDGINASDGSGGMMGVASSGVALDISGGTLYVDADGDGLDSNADMTISGGVVIVNGPTSNNNAALDSESGIYLNGGLVIAAGSAGMAESPESTSEQHCVSAAFGNSLTAGTLVTLCDSDGNEIVSFAPSKAFSHIIISSPDIRDGASYGLYTGGTSSAEERNGLYGADGYQQDGSEAGSFTADDMVSYIGTQGGMMGGFGGGRMRGM